MTLSFALKEAGVPVATSAAVLAFGLSARVWRFLSTPVADLTFDLRAWYAIGVTAMLASAGFLALAYIVLGLVAVWIVNARKVQETNEACGLYDA